MIGEILTRSGKSRRAGFTLVEVVIAIGVFASVAVSILGLLALGTDSVRENSERQLAFRLVGALEEKLGSGGFETVYGALRADPETDFFLYTYTGSPTDLRDDGTAAPVEIEEGVSHRTETGFRSADDALLEEDLAVSSGAVFRVKLSALPPGAEDDGEDYALPTPEDYRHAGLRLLAKYYIEPSADVVGQRPLKSLPEVLTYPLVIPR